jgi:TonB family protein
MSRYDAKGALESKTIYIYHDTDNRIETSYYDPKGTLDQKSIDVYNSGGMLVESSSYKPDGSRIAMSAYIYDGSGNVIEEAFYNVDGLSKWRYIYDFDSNGNWVKQTVAHLVNKSGTLTYDPTDITYRTITYYSGLSKTHQPEDSSLASKVEISETKSALNGVTIKRVEPVYPQQAVAARVSGKVIVQILIEEDGNVISARAMLGDSLLREAAEAAAWHWKLTPTLVGGEPTRARATAGFNFAGR